MKKRRHYKSTYKPIILLIKILTIITLLLCIFNIKNIISYFTDIDTIMNKFSIRIVYTVTFDANTGEGDMPPQKIEENSKKQLNENLFTKKGYTFKEWNTKADGGGERYANSASVSNLGDITLYAQWKPNSYSISYYRNHDPTDNLYNGSSQSMTYDVPANLSKNPYSPPKGYRFTGWNTERDGKGQGFTECEEVSNLTDVDGEKIILYAQWEIEEYKITYDLDGGTIEGEEKNPETYTIETDDFTLKRPTKKGYTFNGWRVNNTTYVGDVTIKKGQYTGELKCTARWTANTYKINFYKNISTSENIYTSQTMKYDESAKLKGNTITRDGYSFVNWNTEKDGNGKSYNDGEEVKNLTDINDGSVNLYAQWQLEEYSITYDLTGGTLGEEEENPEKYTIETDTFTLKNPTKPGYTFKGWTKNENTGWNHTVTMEKGQNTGNIKFTALWTANTYTIYFYRNNSETEHYSQSQEMTYDVLANLKENTITRDGYSFVNWNTQRDGKGQNYVNCEEVKNLTAENKGSVNLYAQWEIVEYSITYDLDGGTLEEGKENPKTYTIETETFTLNNPTKPGYTFKGWQRKGNSGYSNKTSISKGSTGDKEYTALWTGNTYTIYFYRNNSASDGTTKTQKMTYGVSTDLNENSFTREGYRFTGWNTDRDGNGERFEDCQSVINLTAESGGRINLYAQWERVPESIKYAVQIYGIKEDEDLHGNKLGLTFGPATGENYNDKYITHRYEDTGDGTTYKVVIETHTVDANGGVVTEEKDLLDSSGNNVTRTEDEMKKYNINIHEMSWDEIAEKSQSDPTVFTDCMLCGDTKSVKLTLNVTIGTGKKYTQYGDGSSCLGDSIETYYRYWNPSTTQNPAATKAEIKNGSNAKEAGGYSSSHIRATLIGANSDTNVEYAGDLNLSSSTCLYSCIESDLQNVIIAKKVKYVTGSSTSDYSLNVLEDKIWLFSEREIYGTGQYCGTTTEGIGEEGAGYSKFGNEKSDYYIGSYDGNSKTKRKCFSEGGTTTAKNGWLRSIRINTANNVQYLNSSRSNLLQ